MWGDSWRQRLRLAPLCCAIALADVLRARASAPPPLGPWPHGISIVIPERDAPTMLAEALASLDVALETVDEPSQIIVVANGAARSVYDGVAARFPRVEWVHSDAPLGFAGAIQRGLALVRHGGTYLLNNDMTLDPRALAELLPLRGDRVFAVGSQIHQQDATGRREETGFTDWYVDAGGVHLYHAPVPGSRAAVPHLCASGGATLFRTALLARYLPGSRAYDPFYWEDVEWSVRAWREGFEVVFCPASQVAHRHRATTARFYDAAELARVVERNRILFDLRHGASGFGASRLLARVCDLPYASQRDLATLRHAIGVLRHRRCGATPPLPPPRTVAAAGAARVHSSYSFRLREAAPRIRILFVTPFAVFPPRHGGARRVAEFVRGHKGWGDVALVSDEASLYDARSFADFDGLCDVRLVQRGNTVPTDAARDIGARTREHCHPALAAAVRAAASDFRPHVVVVEHAELAPLVRERGPGPRWILDLHDAYGPADFARADDAKAFANDLGRYDALTACSEEDRRLIAHPRVVGVPNGAQVTGISYRPSDSSRLLFVGPFRYGPNREGIVRFLREAWPAVRAAVPEATLTILGGDESAGAARDEPAFAQPGVDVLGHRDDVPRLLCACALAVNPLANIRGSAIKLVETLAAGRVCVTTEDGARGFAASAPPALVIVPAVADMAAPIVQLLRDPKRRHGIEAPDPAVLDAFGWHHSVARQRALFEELLR